MIAAMLAAVIDENYMKRYKDERTCTYTQNLLN